MSRVFVNLFIIFFFYQAKASELTELYRQKTIQVIQDLERNDIEKIACSWGPIYGPVFNDDGCISPQHLIEKLNQIEIIETSQFVKPNGATRWTAFFDPSTENIYINSHVQHDAEMAGLIGLHELLGALNKADEEYQISAFVYLFLENSKRGLKTYAHQFRGHIEYDYGFQALDDAITKANNTLVTLQGGATIVGGGGDEDAFRVRIQLYRYLEFFYEKHFINIPHLHPVLLVEIMDEDVSEIRKQQVNIKGSKTKWTRFLVPKKWLRLASKKDFRAPNLAVEELGQLIVNEDEFSDRKGEHHD